MTKKYETKTKPIRIRHTNIDKLREINNDINEAIAGLLKDDIPREKYKDQRFDTLGLLQEFRKIVKEEIDKAKTY